MPLVRNYCCIFLISNYLSFLFFQKCILHNQTDNSLWLADGTLSRDNQSEHCVQCRSTWWAWENTDVMANSRQQQTNKPFSQTQFPQQIKASTRHWAHWMSCDLFTLVSTLQTVLKQRPQTHKYAFVCPQVAANLFLKCGVHFTKHLRAPNLKSSKLA